MRVLFLKTNLNVKLLSNYTYSAHITKTFYTLLKTTQVVKLQVWWIKSKKKKSQIKKYQLWLHCDVFGFIFPPTSCILNVCESVTVPRSPHPARLSAAIHNWWLGAAEGFPELLVVAHCSDDPAGGWRSLKVRLGESEWTLEKRMFFSFPSSKLCYLR